ncbi:very-long-chain enoyl-CoA reductase-like [Varroa jacobsoni]|uniref:very-long-chain enoyl-CoA reductase n=1 Tax=Varroa destructor TaxID=109461 RepID=A0A7M7J9P2_VARDE|nr:very-long-chain enoyl-CoA reductase-like [Varroa destructor]XP_022704974.1 very-long-chain enoyl-CoA reductase-like [Varroa jacobsoni]
MEIHIVQGSSKKEVCTISGLTAVSTIADVKKKISLQKKGLAPERQALKIDPKSKALSDGVTLETAGIKAGQQLYLKDLGPQIGWTTVFLLEYAGPLVLYLLAYTRPAILYGAEAASIPYADVVHLAAGCWAFHYVKRLLETMFIHRFSHGTMPIFNLFKNCGYYWGFGLYIAYYINHPLYTPPACKRQIYAAFVLFAIAEIGNFSIHLALRNLRPAGSKERRIPFPTANPFTQLFSFVSCPNYTYEVLSWVAFTAMTNTLPVGLFASAGFYQMTVWALGKHRNYKKEFKDYPKNRTAIVPFII